MPPIYAALRDCRNLVRSSKDLSAAAAGGLVSLLAYGIVIFAMSLGPVGAVSALRETSVVFAALNGRVLLHERLTIHRILACLVVAAARSASDTGREPNRR